jgi:methoxymalonate biosynthesis protein
MRILKLVLWDLDDTIIKGTFLEGDEEVFPVASSVIAKLHERGILQVLVTHNPPSVISALRNKYSWSDFFVLMKAELGLKSRVIQGILEKLEVHPLDSVFIDEDPFERDSMRAQFPELTAWSLTEIKTHIESNTSKITEEARSRPQMYCEQRTREQQAAAATDYLDFLRSCNIQITMRSYQPEDKARSQELLTRTHKMNLGVLPVEVTMDRLGKPDVYKVIIAEMRDRYGDMGRCGILQLTPGENNQAEIGSLAISCRTRARGLYIVLMALIDLCECSFSELDSSQCREQVF